MTNLNDAHRSIFSFRQLLYWLHNTFFSLITQVLIIILNLSQKLKNRNRDGPIIFVRKWKKDMHQIIDIILVWYLLWTLAQCSNHLQTTSIIMWSLRAGYWDHISYQTPYPCNSAMLQHGGNFITIFYTEWGVENRGIYSNENILRRKTQNNTIIYWCLTYV